MALWLKKLLRLPHRTPHIHHPIMLISVVTVNLNHASGLIKTIESVMAQQYAFTEHIVVDGGSTDGSLAVIRQNAPHLQKWSSEADRGIYDAQNKGLYLATGKYVLFLNSGDRFYDSHTLGRLAGGVVTGREIVYGNKYLEQADGSLILKEYPGTLTDTYFNFDTPPHCSTLIPVKLMRARGGYDARLRICADWKFFRQVWRANQARFVQVPDACSIFEWGGLSATHRHLIMSERQSVMQEEKQLIKRLRRKADQWAAQLGLWIPHW